MAKRRWRKRRGKKKKRAKVSKNVARYVHRAIDQQVEDKHLYLDPTAVTLNSVTPAVATFLGGWGVGDNWGQRNSQRIKMKRIDLRVIVSWTGTVATFDENIVRFLLVMQNQTNGAAPAAIIDDNAGLFRATNFVAGDYPAAPLNATTTQTRGTDQKHGPKYVVYHDKMMFLESHSTDNSTGGTSVAVTRYKAFSMKKVWPKGCFVTFNQLNAGNITDIIDHSLFLYGCTNVAVAGHGTISYRIKLDITYEDA